MLTGFHGLHVTIGAIILTVVLFRCISGHFTPNRHFAFEAAAWYWHFVDVVWLGLFVFVYWLLEVISPPELPNVFLKAGDGAAGIPQMIVIVPMPPEIASQPTGHQLHHLAFELPADRFDDQEQALRDAGYEPRGGTHPVLASRTIYIDDPDGNEVELAD